MSRNIQHSKYNFYTIFFTLIFLMSIFQSFNTNVSSNLSNNTVNRDKRVINSSNKVNSHPVNSVVQRNRNKSRDQNNENGLTNPSNNFLANQDKFNLQPLNNFIQNNGQIANSEILYYFTNSNYKLAFEKSKISLSLVNKANLNVISGTLSFVNSNDVKPVGVSEINSSLNYFSNQYSLTNMKSYREVVYHNLYNKIDLRYYISNNNIKYDFIVYPGGNPSQIKLQVSPNIKLDISSESVKFISSTNQNILFQDSNLKILTNSGSDVNGQFKEVSSTTYGFSIGSYNKDEILIIDPLLVPLTSTYFGGSQSDTIYKIRQDSNGFIYVVGVTESVWSLNGFFLNTTSGTNKDVFIAKFNSTGNGLIYFTIIGGSGSEYVSGLAIDSSNALILSGMTNSVDYPTTVGSFSGSNSGGFDLYVTKLNSTGNGLDFSTYVGGSLDDNGTDLTLDQSGNIFIAGQTFSNDFPTVNAYDNTLNGTSDGFILELNNQGNSVSYSTYFGGSSDDIIASINITNTNIIYFAGNTTSTDIPTVNSFNNTISGGTDIFVAKLSMTTNTLLYSTYIGGSSSDQASRIFVDSTGETYITGTTSSTNFPTKNSYQSTNAGKEDAFLLLLNATGNGLNFSTYFGGSAFEQVDGLIVNPSGQIIIAGSSNSTDLPAINAYDNSIESYDLFITKFNSTGNGIYYSSFFGYTYDDLLKDMELGKQNKLLLVGGTDSPSFPVINAFDPTSHTQYGNYDGFMTILDNDTYAPVFTNKPADRTIVYGESTTLTWNVFDNDIYTLGTTPITYYAYQNGSTKVIGGVYGGVITWTLNQYAIGVYNMSVDVMDRSGNHAYDWVLVTVIADTFAPTILNKGIYTAQNDSTVIESSHNSYTGPTHWTISKPGAKYVKLFFPTINTVGTYIDSILYVYDENMTLIQQFDGSYSNITLMVESQTVYLTLANHASAVDYGFKLTPVTAYYPNNATLQLGANKQAYALWNLYEPNPSNYSILINGSIKSTGVLQVNTFIFYSIANFIDGTTNITLLANDTYGNLLNDQSLITITPDTTNPAIQATYTPFMVNNITESLTVQSAHPYPNNANQTWTITRANRSYISMYFNYISTESGYDYVKLYDKQWNLVYSFTGVNVVQNQWITVISDTVYIVLTSDSSINNQGFSISQIKYPDLPPSNDVFNFGSLKYYTANWAITEYNPANYSVYENGNLVQQNNYTNGQTIQYVFQNFYYGSYNFSITVYDQFNHVAMSQKNITILRDMVNPIINSSYRVVYSSPIIENVTIESAHPYANNLNQTWTISRPGVTSLSIYFNNISTETNYDYLRIYDKQWNLIQTYTGTNIVQNQWITVNSDKVYIVLTSDTYVNDYGFFISQIKYIPVAPTGTTFIVPKNPILTLNYTVNEAYPTNYSLLMNGSIIYSGNYTTNQTLSFTIGNFSVGIYNVTFIAYDTVGNKAIDQQFFNATVTAPVFLAIPLARTVTQNNKTTTLYWLVSEDYPTYYLIYVNGLLQTNATYFNNTFISYAISYDNLIEGPNTVKIVVYNENHLSNEYSVIINRTTVQTTPPPSGGSSTSSTTSTSTSTSESSTSTPAQSNSGSPSSSTPAPANSSIPIMLPFISLLFVGIASVFARRKRRRND